MTKTLPQPEHGFQPARDEHGYELSDIKDPPGALVSAQREAERRDAAPPPAPATGSLPAAPPLPAPDQVATFPAYDRATGEKVVLDHRTFDPKLHSHDPVEVPSA